MAGTGSEKNETSHRVTELLVAANYGDRSALNQLIPLVYEALHERAASYMRRERPGHTLQPTALVNEAYLRLINQRKARWKDRRHFFAIAATMMRRILVDHARRRRGKRQTLPPEDLAVEGRGKPIDVLVVDEALKKLESFNGRLARVSELRYFAGLSVAEVSEELGVDVRTVQRDWEAAKALLSKELRGES